MPGGCKGGCKSAAREVERTMGDSEKPRREATFRNAFRVDDGDVWRSCYSSEATGDMGQGKGLTSLSPEVFP
jgi:hypothetical protein